MLPQILAAKVKQTAIFLSLTKFCSAMILRSPIMQNAFFVWLIWAIAMSTQGKWELFVDNFFMTITMMFGAFIAGATSEGGGAVAFPVMTIFAGISPHIARDFSLMIQSVGMTAAALTIIRQSIPVEWGAIFYGILGAIPGIILGLEFIAPIFPPPVTKIFFVSLWLVFGSVLLWRLSKPLDEKIKDKISSFSNLNITSFLFVGFIGGIITSFFGSGLDIVTFMLLVLFYNLDEKVATPTSVVLMAIISMIGFCWRSLPFNSPIPIEAWNYWWVSVPVVVVFAPLGAKFIKNRSRVFIVKLLFVSVLIQFVGAQLLIPQSKTLFAVTCATVFGASFLLWVMSRLRSAFNSSDTDEKTKKYKYFSASKIKIK